MTSRVTIAVYVGVALANVASFAWAGHDINKLGIAALCLALAYGQRAIDGWRQAAEAWRHTADEWRKAAHR